MMKTISRNNSPYYFDGFSVVPVGRWNLPGYDGPIDEEIDPRDIQETLDEGGEVYWSVFGHICREHPLNDPSAGGDDTITDHPTEADATAALFQILATLNSSKGKKMKSTDMKRIVADDDYNFLLSNESKILYWLRRQWYRVQVRLGLRVKIFIGLLFWAIILENIIEKTPV